MATSAVYVAEAGLPARYPANLSVLIDDVEWSGEGNVLYDQNFSTAQFTIMNSSATPQTDGRPNLFVWGDSHARILGERITEIARKLGLSGSACVSPGHIPLPGVARIEHSCSVREQLAAREKIMDYLNTTRPRNVILIARWNWYTEGNTLLNQRLNPTSSRILNFHVNTIDHADVTVESNAQVLEQSLRDLSLFRRSSCFGGLPAVGQHYRTSALTLKPTLNAKQR
jgi:hypothetical protein